MFYKTPRTKLLRENRNLNFKFASEMRFHGPAERAGGPSLAKTEEPVARGGDTWAPSNK